MLAHFRATFAGGAKAILPAGEIFVVSIDPPSSATAAICDHEAYDRLNDQLVPEQDRLWHNYSGYSLVINIEAIERDCQLME